MSDEPLTVDRVPVGVINRCIRRVQKARTKGYTENILRAVLNQVAKEEWNRLQKKQPVSFMPRQLAVEVAKHGAGIIDVEGLQVDS